MSPERRLLVLGAGPAQLGLLESARRVPGLHVIAADRDPRAMGFPLAHERAVVSTEDEQAIERLARARDVSGVVSPGADWPVGIAARVAERLGLPHPISAATGAIVTTKTRQRERFQQHGVPHARTMDPDRPTFPCVAKAADRQGQRGLTLVRDASELDHAFDIARREARSGTVILEELVGGPEITVNGVLVEGRFHPLTVTDRVLAPPPAFGVALAHVWPSENATDQTIAVAEAACRAVGIADGPAYVQLRQADDGPRVMEVAARLGGGHDAELCRSVLGVDLNRLAIGFALGESPVEHLASKPSAAVAGGGAVVFLIPPPGTLTEVDGLETAKSIDGVEWVRVYRRPGWRFGQLERGADRAGAVCAVGATRADALARARRAAEVVRFRVDE